MLNVNNSMRSTTTTQTRRKPGWLTLAIVTVIAAIAALVSPSVAVADTSFPDVIPLPNGFAPEGMVIGRGTTVYAGSVNNGAIWKGDLESGEGAVIASPDDGRVALGLAYDRRNNMLWAAGGFSGATNIYDGTTGAEIATIQLTPTPGLVNDVIITPRAAYFTDSFRPVMYRVPLGKRGRPNGDATEIPLVGEFVHVDGEINSNGIVATANGRHLIIANLFGGSLYRVDPRNGHAILIDLGGQSLPNPDGLVLRGRVLHAVQNFPNTVAKVNLNPRNTAGTIVKTITNENFRIPTTGDVFGNSLYTVNARFDAYLPVPFGGDGPGTLEFEIVRSRR